MIKITGRGVAVVLVLLCVGAGLYAGFAFSLQATDQPEFCGSCHVMFEPVRTQQASMHAELACNDCHTPLATVPQMIFKAQSGAKDFYLNTLGKVSDVTLVSAKTKAVVNANCVHCHTMTINNVAENVTAAKQYCTDCHRSVPHKSHLQIAKRRVADE
jgi:cytochrome c nitrite reductase small subunit